MPQFELFLCMNSLLSDQFIVSTFARDLSATLTQNPVEKII